MHPWCLDRRRVRRPAGDGQLDPRHPSGFSGSIRGSSGRDHPFAIRSVCQGVAGSTPIGRRPRIGGQCAGLAGQASSTPATLAAAPGTQGLRSRMPLFGVAGSTPIGRRPRIGASAPGARRQKPARPQPPLRGSKASARGLAGKSELDPSHPWRGLDQRPVRGRSLAKASSTPATLGAPGSRT